MASSRPSPRPKRSNNAAPSGRIRRSWSAIRGWITLPSLRRLAILSSLVAVTVATLILFLEMRRGGLNRFGLQALANGSAAADSAKPSTYLRR